ncbi:MAG: hypothetical protein JXB39_16450 [Deltaproteobacteria bacterium]|nr:hypothetical protein [Deltaproteobacteria bacterium]
MTAWHHLTLASEERAPLFPGDARRLAAVRALARTAGDRLALFFVADDHVHVVAHAPDGAVGRLAHDLLLALRAVAEAEVQPARARPVAGRDHMRTLLDYVLTQTAHHGIPVHPALWAGSCLPDLLGARAILGLDMQLCEALPRVGEAVILDAVGLGREPLVPAGDVALRMLGPARLAAAAARSSGVVLKGREAPVVAARAAAAHLAREAGLPPALTAEALGVTPRGERYLAGRPVPASLLLAVRRRVALDERVAAHPPFLAAEAPPSYGRPLLDEPV